VQIKIKPEITIKPIKVRKNILLKRLYSLKISKIMTIPMEPVTRYDGFPELEKSKNLTRNGRATKK